MEEAFPALWHFHTTTASSLLLLCLWLWWVYRRYPLLATPFHHLLTLVISVRTINNASTSFFFMCSEEDIIAKEYFYLVEAVTFTLYNSFLYMTLIILSKGYLSLQLNFSRNEFTWFSYGLGLYYFLFSVYRLSGLTLQWLFVGVVGVTGIYSGICTVKSIRTAKRHLIDIENLHLFTLLHSAQHKLLVLRCFQVLSAFYFLSDLCLMPLSSTVQQPNKYYVTVVYAAVEFGLVAGVCYLYRVRPLDPLYWVLDNEGSIEDENWTPPMLYQCHAHTQLNSMTESLPVLVVLPRPTPTSPFLRYCEMGSLVEPLLPRLRVRTS